MDRLLVGLALLLLAVVVLMDQLGISYSADPLGAAGPLIGGGALPSCLA